MNRRLKESVFFRWFVSQFGKRPCSESLYNLRLKVDSAGLFLQRAEDLLANTERWEIEHRAALYAWRARTK